MQLKILELNLDMYISCIKFTKTLYIRESNNHKGISFLTNCALLRNLCLPHYFLALKRSQKLKNINQEKHVKLSTGRLEKIPKSKASSDYFLCRLLWSFQLCGSCAPTCTYAHKILSYFVPSKFLYTLKIIILTHLLLLLRHQWSN